MREAGQVVVIGAGSWGTALAIAIARQGYAVHLLARSNVKAGTMQADRSNAAYLPGMIFPDDLQVTADMDVLADAAAVVLAVPCQAAEEWLRVLQVYSMPVIGAFKGFQRDTRETADMVMSRVLGPQRALILSGPSFAKEVAQGLPTALTLAAFDIRLAEQQAQWFHQGNLRVYTSNDMVGVALGGSLKNIIAIAAGVSDGLQLGHNAMAALVTRGMVEISRLAQVFGAKSETLNGLSGLGDLVLTCTGDLSRNRRMGIALAEGLTPGAARTRIGQVVEGEIAAHIAQALANNHRVDMPVTAAVCALLDGKLNARQAVESLLERPGSNELR